MKRLFINILVSSYLILLVSAGGYAAVQAPTKTQVNQQSKPIVYLAVSPIDVVDNPVKYLNKNITFNAELVAFTSLGLDYKPAYRDPAKYIGVLIRRPDVINHTIPLSEMKIFISREVAEKLDDIDAGDKVKISGRVFSTALGDPWVDANVFTVIQKKDKNKQK